MLKKPMTTSEPIEEAAQKQASPKLAAEKNGGENTSDLAPLDIIRTETVLSKLPLHNLAKRGSISIRIIKKNDQGELELLWKVSPSRDYGEPKQLAYKLDTIVINRRIDEEGRPLPKLIRLGSLREIARELGLGGDTETIKKALHQNASAYIVPKLKYKAVDGTERRLETGFSRYSPLFTGEGLPDGRKADAVYLILSDVYREVLNNAPVRPLNYDYLKELPPAAQRFYEIVSYRIFAALKYQHREAKLPYSEYCMFSAQQRYFDYDHFKKQMYKIHRPHLGSGYLKKVTYEQATDGEGKSDWIMLYVPGPKARAEFAAFQRRQINKPEQRPEEEPSQLWLTIGMDPRELVRDFHRRARGVEKYQSTSKETDLAVELIKQHGPEKARFVVEFAVQSARTTGFNMQTFGAVRQYVSDAVQEYDQRKLREEHARQIRAQEEEKERQLDEANRRRTERVKKALRELSDQERQDLYLRSKLQLDKRLPNARLRWTGDVYEKMIEQYMIRELQDQLEEADAAASSDQG